MQEVKSFGKLLKESRNARGFTQEQLAERVGCAVSTIKKAEAETNRFSEHLAMRVATVLEIPEEQRESFVRMARQVHSGGRLPSLFEAGQQAWQNPYKGLYAFEETDAGLFFGRDDLIADLIEHMAKDDRLARFLAVVGASGSGKSSVIRAGLIPALRQGAIPGSEHWAITLLPHPETSDALMERLGKRTVARAGNARQRQFGEHRRSGIETQRITEDTDAAEHVLVIDQFEEIFAPTADANARDDLLDYIHTAVVDANNHLRVIIALRADFYGHPLQHPHFSHLIRQRTVAVPALTPEELEEAIVRPAERVGVEVESSLVAALIHDVGAQPGSLPLLQFALADLFIRQRGHGITLAAYRARGRISGVLTSRADELYGLLDARQKQIARQFFLRLVTPGDGVQDLRRRVRLSELTSILIDETPSEGAATHRLGDTDHPDDTMVLDDDDLDTVMVHYGKERLLIFDKDSAGQPTVEIAHEALIHHWKRLSDWINDHRTMLYLQRGLHEEAANWIRSGNDPSFLARGTRLAQFEELATSGTVALNAEERIYLVASRMQEQSRVEAEAEAQRERESLLKARIVAEQRNTSRLRMFLVIGGVLLVLAVISTGFAFVGQRNARREARVALAQANAGEALFELSVNNPDRASVLALSSILTDAPTSQLVIRRSVRRVVEDTTPSLRLSGHAASVTSVAWSSDGQYILTGSRDRTVRIWDAATGQQVRLLDNIDVASVAWSPDGQRILTGGSDSTARIWDMHNGQLLQAFGGHAAPINAVAWSPDGQHILIGNDDNTASIWDLQTGQRRILRGHTDKVLAVAWSPNGKLILTGSADKTARVWDAANGKPIRRLTGHISRVLAVAWNPDSNQVLTGSDDRTARIWRLDEQVDGRLLNGFNEIVYAAAWSPDGRYVLTGSWDRIVRVWDAASGTLVQHISGHKDIVLSVAWSPDGQKIVTGSDDHLGRIWDVAASDLGQRLRGHRSWVLSVEWNKGGQILTGSTDGTARLWDATTHRVVQTFTEGDVNSIHIAALSPKGQQIFTGHYDGSGYIWSVATGKQTRKLQGHTNLITSAAWSPDGHQVVTGSYDQTARIWDIATGVELYTLSGHTSWVNAVDWSSDGKRIVTGGQDGTIRIWDASNGTLIEQFGNLPAIEAVAWNANADRILVGTDDKTALILNAETGKSERQFKGHTDFVGAVAWSPDEQYVITGSTDHTARIWDTKTGIQLQILEGHTDQVPAVAWSPDGQQVITGSFDRTARIWIVDQQLLIAELTRRVCDIFTDDAIREEIPEWSGCAAALTAVKDDLAAYDRLRGTQ